MLPEIAALERLGHEVWVVPMYPRGELLHEDAEPHLARTLSEPLLSAEIAGEAARELPAAPGRALSLLARTAAARPRIAVKNVAVYPKGLWLARRIRELGAEHVHAHWASVSATLALTGAELAGVPWSFTAHRWDIREGNLLRAKARSACFVRTISESGASELRERVGLEGWSPTVIRMGVDLPASTAPVRTDGPLRLLTAANLLPVKGHRYLFEALAGLEGVALDVAGEGPLRAELEHRARGLPVTFLGAISHSELLERLQRGRLGRGRASERSHRGRRPGRRAGLADRVDGRRRAGGDDGLRRDPRARDRRRRAPRSAARIRRRSPPHSNACETRRSVAS